MMFQSTHAHGVRLIDLLISEGVERFQSTHAHGVRLLIVGGSSFFKLFQSTHAHGVRPGQEGDTIDIVSFNPRTHTACDNKINAPIQEFKVSIHARTRRATSIGVKLWYVLCVSIHARTRRATSLWAQKYPAKSVSIHARTRRATAADQLQKLLCSSFNPRTHTACDHLQEL